MLVPTREPAHRARHHPGRPGRSGSSVRRAGERSVRRAGVLRYPARHRAAAGARRARQADPHDAAPAPPRARRAPRRDVGRVVCALRALLRRRRVAGAGRRRTFARGDRRARCGLVGAAVRACPTCTTTDWPSSNRSSGGRAVRSPELIEPGLPAWQRWTCITPRTRHTWLAATCGRTSAGWPTRSPGWAAACCTTAPCSTPSGLRLLARPACRALRRRCAGAAQGAGAGWRGGHPSVRSGAFGVAHDRAGPRYAFHRCSPAAHRAPCGGRTSRLHPAAADQGVRGAMNVRIWCSSASCAAARSRRARSRRSRRCCIQRDSLFCAVRGCSSSVVVERASWARLSASRTAWDSASQGRIRPSRCRAG